MTAVSDCRSCCSSDSSESVMMASREAACCAAAALDLERAAFEAAARLHLLELAGAPPPVPSRPARGLLVGRAARGCRLRRCSESRSACRSGARRASRRVDVEPARRSCPTVARRILVRLRKARGRGRLPLTARRTRAPGALAAAPGPPARVGEILEALAHGLFAATFEGCSRARVQLLAGARAGFRGSGSRRIWSRACASGGARLRPQRTGLCGLLLALLALLPTLLRSALLFWRWPC